MRTAGLVRLAVGAFVAAWGVAPMPAAAQSTTVVLKGGVAVAGLQIGPSGAARRTDRTTGFVGGLALTVPAHRKFGFQSEVLVHEKGIPAGADGRLEAVPHIVVPVLLRVRAFESESTRVGLLMGPQFTTRATQSRGLIDERGSDYDITIGADIEMRRRVVADVRYVRSLVSLAPGAGVHESVKTRGLTAMVGWRLH